jgi:hypothetical protein
VFAASTFQQSVETFKKQMISQRQQAAHNATQDHIRLRTEPFLEWYRLKRTAAKPEVSSSKHGLKRQGYSALPLFSYGLNSAACFWRTNGVIRADSPLASLLATAGRTANLAARHSPPSVLTNRCTLIRLPTNPPTAAPRSATGQSNISP